MAEIIQIKDGNTDVYPQTFEIRKITSAEATIASNSTTWIAIPTPTGYHAVGAVGYYLTGSNNTVCNVYAITPSENLGGNLSFALRNMGTTQAAIVVEARLLLKKI